MIIDAWLQHPTAAFLRDPMFASLMRWRGLDPHALPDEIPAAFTLAALDAAKVDRGLVSAWWGPQGPLLPNDEVAALVRAHPDRFVGLTFVDPTQEDAERRTTLALRDLGLRGICLLPAMHRLPLFDERVLRVASIVAQQPGAVLWVHCGLLSIRARALLGVPSRFEMRFGNPLDIQAVATAHPSLPIVIPHFGAGLLREALMLADACPNVYFDTSSSNRWIRFHAGLTLADVFAQALDVVGADRILFGTDSSSFPRGWQRPVLERQREVLRDIGAGDDVTGRIFGGNFDRLFPLRA